jgi:hypothetical protein
MRKLLLALFVMFFMAGLVIAAEVTSVSYDKDTKVFKVKEGDAEKTYKITDKTKFTTTDNKGENAKEAKVEDFAKRAAGKDGKGGAKFEIKTDKDEITEVSWKTKGK